MKKILISLMFLNSVATANFYTKGGFGGIHTNSNSIVKLEKENKDVYPFLKDDKKSFTNTSFSYLFGGIGYQYNFQNLPLFIGSEVLVNYKNQTLNNSFNNDGIVDDEGVERITSVKGNTSLKLKSGIGGYVLAGYKINNDLSFYVKKGISFTHGTRFHKAKVTLEGLGDINTNTYRSNVFKNLEIGSGIEYKINEKFAIGGEFIKSFGIGFNKISYKYGTIHLKYNF